MPEDVWAAQFDCVECQDSGFELAARLRGEGAKPCECRVRKILAERFRASIARTPRRFSWIEDGLNSIKPDAAIHPKHPETLELIKRADNREKSWYLFGRTGTHKTTLAIALMQESARRGMPVSFEIGRKLIDNIRAFQFDKKPVPVYPGAITDFAQLETNEQRCIVIDEIEDTASTLSAYTLSILFGIVDRAMSYDHHLLITSNVSLERLLNRWIERDRSGEADALNYANKIYRRLTETCAVVDFS